MERGQPRAAGGDHRADVRRAATRPPGASRRSPRRWRRPAPAGDAWWATLASGRLGVLAAEGDDDPPTSSVIASSCPGRDGSLGRLEVWGAPDEDDAPRPRCAWWPPSAPAASRTIGIERERADDRIRARRLGAAATAVREPRDPREAVARVLAEARALVGAPAAALLAAGTPDPRGGGLRRHRQPLSGRPGRARARRARAPSSPRGGPGRGPRAEGSPLRERGFASAALVGMGPRAGARRAGGVRRRPRCRSPRTTWTPWTSSPATSPPRSRCRSSSQEVRELGAVDPTTRFFNARYFHSRLDQECQRALRAGVPLSVAIMSLDGLGELRERGRRRRRRDRRGGAGRPRGRAAARHGRGLPHRRRRARGDPARGGGARRPARGRAHCAPPSAPPRRWRASFTLSVGVASFPSQAGRPESLDRQRRPGAGVGALPRRRPDLPVPLGHRRDPARRGRDETPRRRRGVLTTIAALVATIDARHPSTAHHSENVGRLAP